MKEVTTRGLVFDGILLFLFIYAPTLTIFPLPMSKLVMCFLFAYVFLKGNLLRLLNEFTRYRFFKYATVVCLILVVYFFNWTTFSGDYNYAFVQMLFWFSFEGIFTTFLLYKYLSSKYDLFAILNLILNVVFIQGIFIILAFVSPIIRESFDSVLVLTDERSISSYRIRGFSNGGGAGLSYLQCIGVFSGCTLLLIKGEKALLILGRLIIITISLFFVARTGLIFSILIILAALFQYSYNKGSIFLFFRYILTSIVSVFLLYILIMPLLSTETKTVLDEKVFERVFEIYYNYEETGELETRSTTALSNMYILPDHDFAKFFGEGLWDSAGDRSDPRFVKRKVDSDVGIVRLIFAIGIPLTIFFYSIYYVFIQDLRKSIFISKIGFLVISLVVIFIVGETKEPFLVRMSGIIKLLVLTYLSLFVKFHKNRIVHVKD